MKRRWKIGSGLVASTLSWVVVAGYIEARRIDTQREARPPAASRPAAVRIDSERLMATVETLTDPRFEGRGAGTPGGIAARAWIEEQFKAVGLQPVSGSFVFPFHFKRLSLTGMGAPGRPFTTDTSAANVVGQCLGTDPKAPVFVVSAHYDHLGARDGAVYPGADDNASGIAVLLALAEQCRLSPFSRTLLFAAFDAEELGLQGSKAFLIAPPVKKERIALNVNIDMVGRSDRRELFAAGTYQWPHLKAALDEVAEHAPVTLLFGHDRPIAMAGGIEDWTDASDHASFNDAGIPFVYFGVEDHADSHQPTDTADRINRGFFVDAAETILDALVRLDAVERGGPVRD